MIRPATEEDLPRIAELIEAYFDEVQRERNFPVSLSKERILAHLITLLKDPEVIFLLEDQGMIAGPVIEMWFGDDRAAEEQIFYVTPNNRNGFLAKRLLEEFEKESKKRGAKGMFFTNFTGIGLERFERFLLAFGFQPQGGIFLKVFD